MDGTVQRDLPGDICEWGMLMSFCSLAGNSYACSRIGHIYLYLQIVGYEPNAGSIVNPDEDEAATRDLCLVLLPPVSELVARRCTQILLPLPPIDAW